MIINNSITGNNPLLLFNGETFKYDLWHVKLRIIIFLTIK